MAQKNETLDPMKYDYLFKLLIVGDPGVGKSSIMTRYVGEDFEECTTGTVGLDFRIRIIQLNGIRIRLQIWDSAGHERYRPLTTTYYRGSDGIVIVYDITDDQTFEHVTSWVEEVNRFTDKDVPKIVVGNKCDLNTRISVDNERAREYAKNNGMFLFQTSAKSSKNIENAFEQLVSMMIGREMALTKNNPDRSDRTKSVILDDNQRSKDNPNDNSGCC